MADALQSWASSRAYHRLRSRGVGAKIIRYPQLLYTLAQFLQKFTAFFCVFHLGLGLVQPVAASRRALDLDNGDRRKS